MHDHLKMQTSYYHINWKGVLGLAAMAVAGALGWFAIISGFRAALR